MRGHRALVASLPLAAMVGIGSAQALDLVKADSSNPFSLKARLHASAVVAWVDQDDPFDGLREHTFVFRGKLELRGAHNFLDGSQFGAILEFELDNEDDDLVLSDNGSDVIDEAYIYYKSVYGHLQFGAVDGAAAQMSIRSPSVTRGPRINGGDVYFFEDTFTNIDFRPVALRTDLYASGDNIKIVYFSPRRWGLQAGVSYMPEFSHDLGDFFNGGDTDFDQQSQMLEIGINYAGSIGPVDLVIGGTYLKADNEFPEFFGLPLGFNDDLEEWGAGVNIGFGIDRFAVRLGASYKESNASGGIIFGNSGSGHVNDAIETRIWEAGVVVGRGPWSFGAGYIRGDSQEFNFFVPSDLSFLDGEAFEVGVGYKLGPGLRLNLTYQHYEYRSDPTGLFFTEFYNFEHSAELDTVFLEATLDL